MARSEKTASSGCTIGRNDASRVVAERDGEASLHALAAALSAADLDRRRLEATLQAIPVGVWICDAAGHITHSNPTAARIWGGVAPHAGSAHEYSVYRAWWPHSGKRIEADEWAMARTLRTGETISGEAVGIERFDGTRGYVLNSTAAILDAEGRITGGVSAVVDITDSHNAQWEREHLLASLEIERSRLAAIFERAPAFMAVLRGPTFIFERANPACHALLGRTDLVGKTVIEAVPEVEAQGFIQLLERVRITGEPYIGRQIPVSLARGEGTLPEIRYMDFVYLRVEDPDGETRVVAHGVDITEQVVVANALRRTEQRLRDQFAKLPVPTFLWEERGDDFILIDYNDAAIGLVLPQWEGAIGRWATQLFPGSRPLLDDARKCLHEGIVIQRRFEFDLAPGVEPRTFDLTLGPQPPGRVLVHAVDTTEQTRLSNQLRQAQKMDAVGQLAGGVAHDFNNLLTVISAHSALLLEELPEDDARRQDAHAILQASTRAASLTRQLLAFSRKQLLKPALVDLNLVVEETHRLLDRLVGEDFEVVLALSPDLGLVLVDVGQVEQVVMNLVLNSRDAMLSGGRLSILTKNVTVGASVPALRGIVPPGAYALLSVSDSGAGMDAHTQAHLFEPFFTTKPLGKGTGLGLSTVYGIVKQSAGYVLVDSRLGEGSTFDVYLPLAEGRTIAAPSRATKKTAERCAETILLVEDDDAVRGVAKRLLLAEGYHVLEARDGQSALALSASHEGQLHGVVTDAVMPGITGVALLEQIRAERPECKAILMSGYTNDEMTRRGIRSSDVTFVQKPFNIQDFARLIRQALDS